ncbi:helix-turn-helix domain-containing protein [Pikeienuella piscinae]|uniref:Helix-turn-helix domain-containing protein n=1 Tax=Pikeienuella piscinae TaxID=2748098 RepID=A0A7L5C0V3_9RHOB|nr:helix-turn-helix domain-containing protein [Pikeienuella piscinae]QIE57013.1 helix-turn-helix domain-containing protein [Pikeienuella piscinae]
MNKPIKAKDLHESAPIKLLLDYPAAAEALSMTRGALRDLVYKGRGPVVTKIGNRTFFAVKDLERFVEEHRQGPQG